MLHRLSLLLLLLCSAIVAPATLTVYDMKALGFRRDPFVNRNGFVEVYYNNEYFGTTDVNYNNSNPAWEEIFSYGNANYGSRLKLKVYDRVGKFDELLGFCVTYIISGDNQHSCDIFTEVQLFFSYSLH